MVRHDKAAARFRPRVLSEVVAWANACARHGVYLHPVHNWFLSTAHDAATIDAALQRTDLAFGDLRRSLGAD